MAFVGGTAFELGSYLMVIEALDRWVWCALPMKNEAERSLEDEKSTLIQLLDSYYLTDGILLIMQLWIRQP